MSVLLLDAGNTRLKWAVSERGRFVQQGAFAYAWQALSEQFEAQWAALLASHPIKKLVLCNVAGERLESALQHWLDDRVNQEMPFQETAPLTIEPVTAQAQAFGVKCAYEEPAQLGADRWAALVAARHHIAGACCVIDAGTALTIDVLNDEGVHVGGVIAPGMAIMRQSLQMNTAQVDADDTVNATLFSVRNTAAAVQAGIMAAAVGAVRQVLAQCRKQGLQTPVCVVTGGDAQALLPNLPGQSVLETEWVLKGLAIIAGEHE
jgi:type III pantothenate kinase